MADGAGERPGRLGAGAPVGGEGGLDNDGDGAGDFGLDGAAAGTDVSGAGVGADGGGGEGVGGGGDCTGGGGD